MLSKRSRGVIFDATCLHYFALVHRLDLLEHRYGGNAHVGVEVLREIRNSALISPELNLILSAEWLQAERVVELDDLVVFNNLLRRWGRSDRNRGEAATLVLAKHYGWAAVIDDKKGREAAKEFGVSHFGIVGILARLAKENVLSAGDAWAIHEQMTSIDPGPYWSPLRKFEDFQSLLK